MQNRILNQHQSQELPTGILLRICCWDPIPMASWGITSSLPEPGSPCPGPPSSRPYDEVAASTLTSSQRCLISLCLVWVPSEAGPETKMQVQVISETQVGAPRSNRGTLSSSTVAAELNPVGTPGSPCTNREEVVQVFMRRVPSDTGEGQPPGRCIPQLLRLPCAGSADSEMRESLIKELQTWDPESWNGEPRAPSQPNPEAGPLFHHLQSRDNATCL